ncbi:TolC family protein [Sediminibacterium soli]|uniref:TolC family protein n=1 Tax=Sediminibacterium soli TaxID=2698829 RepID=UPI00137AD865|nr:TolC family protein [Sediminibacterium soli]NCI45549.1 TolC family protein [Sediminibacterium soli]
MGRSFCRNFFAGAALALALQTGLQAQESVNVNDEVSYPFLGKLIDTARKYYPKMRSFDHRINIANSNITKARLSWFDIFTFSYLYSPNNSTTLVNPSLFNGYQLGMFVNIGSLITKPHNIRQAREQLAISKLDKEEYNLNIEAEVKMRYFRYVKELTMLKAMSQGLVDAENAMKQLRYKFEKSETTFEEYSRSLLVYADRRQSVIESQGALLVAKSSLEELVVKKLEDIK